MPALGPRESEPGLSNVMLYNSHGQTVLMNNSPASMANVSWLSNLIGTTALQVVQMAFDHSVPGANGLSFVPFINGGGHYSAGFVGLRSFHGKADMARAVVEGVVALHAKSLNAMCHNRFERKRLFVLGGGSGDMRMCQLLASMLGEPVLTPGVDESGARGAAMYGAMAIGQPTAQLAAPLHSVAPNPEWQKHYATFLQDFEQLLSTMEPVFAFKKGVQP
jgi:L-xylulokinase